MCNACSQNREVLEEIGYTTAVRVCDKCVDLVRWCVCGTNKRALELLQNHVVDSTVVELRAPHAVNRALHTGICYIESGVLHLTFLS